MKTKTLLKTMTLIISMAILKQSASAQSLSLLDSAFITVDKSARPEVIVYNNKSYVFYLNTTQPRTFDIKIFNTSISSQYYYRTFFSGSPLIGYPTDIRIARDSNTVVAFFETVSIDSTRLWGARYYLDDSLTVETQPFLIATGPTEANTPEGVMILNDPSPLVTNNAIYVGCRLRDTYLMQDSSRIFFYKYDKSTFTLSNQFLLDFTNTPNVDGGVRVFSLLFNNNYIYLTLTSTTSNTGVTDYQPSLSDIVLVKLDTNWNVISSQTIFSEVNIKPLQITGLQYENGYYFLSLVMGKLGLGYSRIELFDSFLNHLYTENVLQTTLGPGSVALRPSIYVNNDTVFSGNGYPVLNSSALIKRYVFNPVTTVEENLSDTQASFVLYQNYPNPFNPTTSIKFQVSDFRFVSLKIFDVLGREVETLVNGELHAGEHSVQFNAEQLASGIYFYRLSSGTLVQQKKMVVLR